MNIMNIAVCLVASLLYLLLFAFSLRVKRRTNRIFSAYLLAMGLWTSTSVMWFADFPVLGDLPWLQTGLFFSIIAWMLMCLLSVVILGLDSVPAVRAGLWVIYSLGGLLLIGDVGGQLIRVTRIERGHFDVQFYPPIYPFFALTGLSGVALILLFARASIKTDDHNQRNRLLYFAISNILITAGGFANILPQLRPFPFDVLFDVVAALLIAYAILRYRLLDIIVVVRKGLLYSIPTAIIGAGYFLIISVAMRLFHALAGPQILLLSLLVAAITAVIVQPLRDRVQLWIDRLFFREKYDSSLMLQRLSRTAASVLDLDRLTSMILDEVTTTIHIERTAFFLREESGEFRLMAQRGPEQTPDLKLRKDHPIVDWLFSHEHGLTRHDMEVMPQFKALWEQEREDLERIGTEFFIPLEAKGELVGILAVGPKLSEVAYSQDDQLTLTTLANQIAIAIQNARLYSGLEASLEELKQTQAQLIQASKMSALGELISGVAHEVNNPLTTVAGYAQLLQKEELSRQVKEDLKRIHTEAMRACKIIQNLLVFARQYEPIRKYVDLNEVIEQVLAIRAHQLELDNIEVIRELEKRLPGTLADPDQMKQVFLNLINNAHYFMVEAHGGGTLTIRSQSVEGKIRAEVIDDGPGIPEENLDKIFDPFFTTKEVGEGTGLGLSVSYGIVRDHGGRIWAESPSTELGTGEEGKGATFVVELPIKTMEPTPSEEAPAERGRHRQEDTGGGR